MLAVSWPISRSRAGASASRLSRCVLGHFDLRDVRRELADQPVVVHLEVRVGNTDRVLEQCRRLRGHVVLPRPPIQGGGHERLGLACVAHAVLRLLHGGEAPPAETAQAARRLLLAERQVRAGSKRGAEHVLEPFGKLGSVDLGVVVRVELLLPERLRIFLRAPRQRDQCRVSAVGEQDRLTLGTESGPVSFEQQRAHPIRRHVHVRRLRRQQGAGGKPHEIARKGQLAGFVEVVDPPDQPLSRVPPDTEVLHVQIADRKQHVLVSLGKPWTHLRPLLDPAVERRPQKRERPRTHLAVLVLEQPPGDVRPLSHPRLEGACGFEDAAHVSPGPCAPRHIQAHLDEDLSLDVRARRHRCRLRTSNAPSRRWSARHPRTTWRGLRLERAAFRLLIHDATLLDIALDCGFQNHETFTRAFRRRFGMPPSKSHDGDQESPGRAFGHDRGQELVLSGRHGW